MSESDKYSWSLKNGDLQALKELVSKKVSNLTMFLSNVLLRILCCMIMEHNA